MSSNLGVFTDINEAIAACMAAQKVLASKLGVNGRQKLIDKIREVGIPQSKKLGELEYAETGYGRPEHKESKERAAFGTPDTSALRFQTFANEHGMTIDYPSPWGVIGSVTPVTNPVSTIIGNTIANIAAGNGVVFNPHPASKNCAAYTIRMINGAIVEAGGPENLVVMAEEPSMDSLDAIMKHPKIGLIIGTGGPGMVRTLMASGKKIIAAGAGNPPCIIDETADVEKAAWTLYNGTATYENAMLCVAEKEVFVHEDVADKFMDALEKNGGRRLTKEESEAVIAEALVLQPNGEYVPNKKWVGKNCGRILEAAGVKVEGDPMLAFFETEFETPFVLAEQLMPILPVVRVKSFEQALEYAIIAEHGYRHSACIWTKDSGRASTFAAQIDTTCFCQNGSMMAPFGDGGAGNGAPTIATPTGEGVTDVNSFTRKRRFSTADGLNTVYGCY